MSVLQFSADKTLRATTAGALAQQGEAEEPKLAQSGEELALGEANRSSSVPVGRLLRRWSKAMHSDKC